jgi:argininosuccinate lyase
MKLWKKGESENVKIDQFTVGKDREYDLILAEFDLEASIAHAKMLGKVKILTINESEKIIKELEKIKLDAKKGKFTIENEFEDMHSKIEYLLTEKLGDLGKKIHTARSRNDQVLVSIQLYIKQQLSGTRKLVKTLFDLLLKLAAENKNELMPGYTHMQIAMPSSFGLWFSAYAECLIDDIIVLKNAISIVDQNPLGSGAGFGSSFPIDRNSTTKSLGFTDLKYNVLAAQMSRGKIEKTTASALGSLASSISKFCMDICLYMGQDFNFISFPDSFTTGSSIMPHKKNPDVFELIRGKCNIIQGLPQQLALLTNNLPSGYHREMQLSKGPIIEAFKEIKSCVEILLFSLENIKIRKNITDDNKYDHLFSVDTLNEWVKKGMPFRDAYQKMKSDIMSNNYIPIRKISHSHIGSIGNLNLNSIKLKMKKHYT